MGSSSMSADPIPTGEIYVSRNAMPSAKVGDEQLAKVRLRVVRVDADQVLLTLAPLNPHEREDCDGDLISKSWNETVKKEEEVDQFIADRKAAGLKIDPATAEVTWDMGVVGDPYDIQPDMPAEYLLVGRRFFARAPGGDWVSEHDLPAAVLAALRDRMPPMFGARGGGAA
jgi:hypothetical protein